MGYISIAIKPIDDISKISIPLVIFYISFLGLKTCLKLKELSRFSSSTRVNNSYAIMGQLMPIDATS